MLAIVLLTICRLTRQVIDHRVVFGLIRFGVAIISLTGLPVYALTVIDSEQQGVGGVTGLEAPTGMLVSPDQRHLYVSSAAGYIAAFTRDAASGMLTFVAAYRDQAVPVLGSRRTVDITVSPDGAHLYAAGLSDGSITIFARDAASGRLQFLSAINRGDPVTGGILRLGRMAISTDGAFLYLASHHIADAAAGVAAVPDRLVVVKRNAVTGLLAHVASYVDGEAGIDGLTVPVAVHATPDGRHLLVTAAGDHSLSVYARDAATGTLTLTQLLRNGLNGITGIDDARAIGFDPFNNQIVYVGGTTEDALLVFRRDEVTGQLQLTQTIKDNVGGIDGIDGIHTISVDGESSLVYASGSVDNAIAVFARHPLSGALNLIEAAREPLGSTRLQAVGALTLAHQPARLYSLALTSNQLVSWQGTSVDLALTQQTVPSLLRVGDHATVTFLLTNIGVNASPQTRVVLMWPPTKGLTTVLTSAVATVETIDLARGLALINAGVMAPGESRSVAIDATLAASTPAAASAITVPIRARAHAAASETAAANNQTSATLVFEPVPPNRLPSAIDDSVVTQPNTSTLIGVLANDSDPDSDSLSVSVPARSAQGASITLETGGSIRYAPAPGFFGQDSFTYAISDGHPGGTATAQVLITVNTAPAAADDSAITLPNTPVEIDLFANDVEHDDGALRLVKIVTDMARGSVTVLNGGRIAFAPEAGFHGSTQFSYEVADALAATANATVTVIVNSTPIAPDIILVVEPGVQLDLGAALGSVDADGDILRLDLDASMLTPIATLVAANDGSGISSQLRVAKDAIGGVTLPYTVTDEYGAAATAQLRLTVNTAPLAVADEITTSFETPATILVLYNDEQRDASDGLTLLFEQSDQESAAGGMIAIAEPSTGQLALKYSPPSGFSGDDLFSYTISDAFGKISQAAVTVHVTAPPREPSIVETPSTSSPPSTNPSPDGGGGVAMWLLFNLTLLALRRRRA